MKKIIPVIIVYLLFLNPSLADTQVKDCFEKVNRATFSFNQALDRSIFEPVAKGYRKLPSPVRKGTGNVLSNLSNLITIPNNILQGNFNQLGHSVGSFVVNSTVGILGFLNPAEKIGLKPHKEDVGQTLASYGIGPGCYFVLPILGPTTARDSVGLIADTFVDPFAHVTIRQKEIFGSSGTSLDYYSVKGTGAIDFRSSNDKNLKSLEKNSLDLYSSFKSIYLQDRENKIRNSIEDQDEWGNLDN